MEERRWLDSDMDFMMWWIIWGVESVDLEFGTLEGTFSFGSDSKWRETEL